MHSLLALALAAAAPTLVSAPSPLGRCVTTGAATNAEVEPSLAVDPRNPQRLVTAYQQDRYLRGGGARGIVVATSTDGGTTWRRTALPVSRCAGGGAAFASDPWVTVGPEGRLYVSALSTVVSVVTSTDWGRHWSRPSRLRGRGFSDKPALTADPLHPGTAYLVWSDYLPTGKPGTESDELLAITSDGGRTWSSPRAIVRHGRESGPEDGQVVVDPVSGRLHLFTAWVEGGLIAPGRPGAMQISESADGGATWSPARRFAAAYAAPQPRGAVIRSSPQVPSFGVDGAGALYATWQDSRFSHGRRDDVLFTRSTDGGVHWGAPRRIGSGIIPVVAGAGEGSVALLYLRADRPSLRAQYRLARSSDGGRHFRDAAASPSFSVRDAPLLTTSELVPGGYFLGDYMGLAPAGPTAYAAVYVTAAPHPGDPTDVFFTHGT